MTTRIKKNYIPIALLLLTFALTVTVRQWFPALMGVQGLQTASLKTLDALQGDEVFWSLDYVNAKNDILTESVFLDGYAFILTDEDDGQREVSLFLLSEKGAYQAKAQSAKYHHLCLTGDRLNNYERYVARLSEDVISTKDAHGFTAEFSTLSLPNGVYELAFAVRENESVQGFSRTGILFQKNNRSFSLVKSEDKVFDINYSAALQEGVSGELDHVQPLAGGDIFVEGWLRVDGLDPAAGTVILEASDETHQTITFVPTQHLDRVTRTEDGKIHHEPTLFRAVIPMSAGFNGTVTLRGFLLAEDGTLYLLRSDRSTAR